MEVPLHKGPSVRNQHWGIGRITTRLTSCTTALVSGKGGITVVNVVAIVWVYDTISSI